MESRAKLVGHAVHPILIVFPLGLLGMAAIFDLIYLGTGTRDLATASYWMIAAGVVTGLLAAVFGFWVRVYRRSRRVIDVAVNTIAGPASKLPHDGAAAGPLCQVCLVQ